MKKTIFLIIMISCLSINQQMFSLYRGSNFWSPRPVSTPQQVSKNSSGVNAVIATISSILIAKSIYDKRIHPIVAIGLGVYWGSHLALTLLLRKLR
jgi:hypothetical protein